MKKAIEVTEERTELNNWFLYMMKISQNEKKNVLLFDLIKELVDDADYLKPANEYHTFFAELAKNTKDEKKRREILDFAATLERGVA